MAVIGEHGVGMSEWREGVAFDLTSDNDEFGVICFGDCWPAMKAALARAEKDESRYALIVRCVSVTERQRRKVRSIGGCHFQKTTFDRRTGKVRTRFL